MNRPRRAKSVRTVPFDAAEFLADDEAQLAYLNAALAEGNAQAMVAALGTVARARGMSGVAKRSGLGRESLYKALSNSGNPAFATIVGVASALGFTFEMRAAPAKRAGTGDRA
jgi:probable addiction module antidote protein